MYYGRLPEPPRRPVKPVVVGNADGAAKKPGRFAFKKKLANFLEGARDLEEMKRNMAAAAARASQEVRAASIYSVEPKQQVVVVRAQEVVEEEPGVEEQPLVAPVPVPPALIICTAGAFNDDNSTAWSDVTGPKCPCPTCEQTWRRHHGIAVCSICFEDCRPVFDPAALFLVVRPEEDDVPYGLHLGPKEDGHVACLSCAREYVEAFMKADGRCFPVHCHECDYELTDDDASRILGDDLEKWHFRKLLDAEKSTSFFCPNPSCSYPLNRHDEVDIQPDGECPMCHTLVCARCEVPWHTDFTCGQYQAIPPEERANPDASFYTLARDMGWSRCPGCKSMCELKEGCCHITCICKAEHCYICGSDWYKRDAKDYGRCSRVPLKGEPKCVLFITEWHGPRPAHRDAAMQFVVAPLQAAVQAAGRRAVRA